MRANYPALTFFISPHSQGGYRLELRFVQPDSQGEVDPLSGQEEKIVIDRQALETSLDASDYGKRLSQSLFASESIRDAFLQAQTVAAATGQPLRVILQTTPDAREIQSLRWETLFDPGGQAPLFAGEKVLFSRYLSSATWAPVRLRPKRQLRALLVVANPSDLAFYSLEPVDVPSETERARKSLGKIETLQLPSTTMRASLEDILRQLRQNKVDILYIVAHGATVKSDTWLWLENEQGATARISGRELNEQIQKLESKPALVMLMACQSAGDETAASSNLAFTALGPRLAEAGIPAVLAMQGKISMETSGRFSSIFLEELVKDGQLDRAAGVARNAVRSQADFWMPALFTRLEDGSIFGEPGLVEVQERGIQTISRSIWIGLGLVALILLGLGYGGWQLLRPEPPPDKMTKDFNVAVAEIAVVDEQGKLLKNPDGFQMSRLIYDRLQENLGKKAADLITEVWPPEYTGMIAGDTVDARAKAAEELAKRRNAYVVIYGQIQEGKDGAKFSPEFYVNAANFQNVAPEISGGNRFGQAVAIKIPFDRDQAATENKSLVERNQALSLLSIGLAYYAVDDYTSALNIFEQAVNLPGWLDEDGKELAYLMSANARNRLAATTFDPSGLPQALNDFKTAWAISYETYGRALAGMGGVTYQLAIGPPPLSAAQVDREKLAQAEALFKQALDLPNQPKSYNLPAKVHYSLGQIYQVRASILGEPGMLERAASEYQTVIDEFDGGNRSIQEAAALAYSKLALISWGKGELEKALVQFQSAIDNASPHYQAEFIWRQGQIYHNLGMKARQTDVGAAMTKLNTAVEQYLVAIQIARDHSKQELIDQFQPDLAATYFEQGRIYAESQNWEHARDLFNQAEALLKKNLQTAQNLVVQPSTTPVEQKIRQTFIDKYQPSLASYYYAHAQADLSAGEKDEARQKLSQVLELYQQSLQTAQAKIDQPGLTQEQRDQLQELIYTFMDRIEEAEQYYNDHLTVQTP